MLKIYTFEITATSLTLREAVPSIQSRVTLTRILKVTLTQILKISSSHIIHPQVVLKIDTFEITATSLTLREAVPSIQSRVTLTRILKVTLTRILKISSIPRLCLKLTHLKSQPHHPGSAFIKPDQRNPWIKDQIKITLLPTISHLLLPNFVSCGRACPSHMTQNLVTVGAKLWTADRFIVDP